MNIIASSLPRSNDVKQKHYQNFNYGNLIRRINTQKACSEWIVWSRSVLRASLTYQGGYVLVPLEFMSRSWDRYHRTLTPDLPWSKGSPRNPFLWTIPIWIKFQVDARQVTDLCEIDDSTVQMVFVITWTVLVRHPETRQVHSDSFHCHEDRACWRLEMRCTTDFVLHSEQIVFQYCHHIGRMREEDKGPSDVSVFHTFDAL
jgi:hypothetical protein